ncbi:MAG: GNAT family N-acetyltransferase [Pseudomonadota bacterium]
MEIQISFGLAEAHRTQAAVLFWDAFRGKLGKLMGLDPLAITFFTAALDPNYVFTATDDTGKLIGLAGFKTAQGAFTDGSFADLQSVYGLWGAIWRAIMLGFFDRPVAPGILLMDAICVAKAARGQSVGTRLLDAIKAEAKRQGLSQVRLDVIDTNPRARALYEKQGFVAGKTKSAWPLRRLLGFNSSTTMVWTA